MYIQIFKCSEQAVKVLQNNHSFTSVAAGNLEKFILKIHIGSTEIKAPLLCYDSRNLAAYQPTLGYFKL